MFGHQDDQDHHHHDDDHQPMENVLNDDQQATLVAQDDFNPALPVATDDQPALVTPAAPADDNVVAPAAPSDDLLSIKQQALTELSPLVGHLDQSPEEKFRTTMMMIQASDNQGLIKNAYEAAQAIRDEKVKAQALLDIVNEINYFTQQNS